MSRRHVCAAPVAYVQHTWRATMRRQKPDCRLGTAGGFDPVGLGEAAKGGGNQYIEQSGTRRTKEKGGQKGQANGIGWFSRVEAYALMQRYLQ